MTSARVNPKKPSHNLRDTVREIILENPKGINLQEIYFQISQRYPLTERQKARDPKHGHINFQHLTRAYIQLFLIPEGSVIHISRGKYGVNPKHLRKLHK